ncbi:hypothetical protein [Halanaeroarchaeum sulfurireducens]|uniref:Uncharacterized protein n=1 Tax=Halanaeroarchaeum sulfurireducens TaxID=1604004 RepID=A0A0F7PGF4_9EURY|nr:hypothetical protein [Halanaeroarchaeum sulfurireducens]AKH98644.1 hypothetical protein HLASF_3018 [Halanaeroarchaeum sulfurireducens]ALG83086.1 hypothetical protein HLASA_3018 [Halanaeroarchaeum sulfurireducens]
MVTPNQLTLFGLILDGLGALTIAGFRIRPINKLSRYIWPRYRKISYAWATLHDEAQVTSQNYGSHTLAFELNPPEQYEKLKAERKELKCKKIELEDAPNKPLKEKEISVEITDSKHMPDKFDMSLTKTMTRETAMSLINDKTEYVFLKTGAILLILGFALQIVAKYAQMNSIQFPKAAPIVYHPVSITLEIFLLLFLLVVWLGKMNDPRR